jgi:hypothetical protein
VATSNNNNNREKYERGENAKKPSRRDVAADGLSIREHIETPNRYPHLLFFRVFAFFTFFAIKTAKITSDIRVEKPTETH